jgi:hypothetical protein
MKRLSSLVTGARVAMTTIGLIAMVAMLPLFLIEKGNVILLVPSWAWYVIGLFITGTYIGLWWRPVSNGAFPWHRSLALAAALGIGVSATAATAIKVACARYCSAPFSEVAEVRKAYTLDSDSMCRQRVVLYMHAAGTVKLCISNIDHPADFGDVADVRLLGRRGTFGIALDRITLVSE